MGAPSGGQSESARAKAGSLAIWNGATWHASAARNNPGLRVTLVQNYMRTYMRVQHNYEATSPQLLEKYPELERVIGKSLYLLVDFIASK